MASTRGSQNMMPIAQFKASSSLLIEELQHGRSPIVVTQNDEAAFVAVSPDNYDALHERLAALQEQVSFMAAVNEGLDDAHSGRTLDERELDEFLKASRS